LRKDLLYRATDFCKKIATESGKQAPYKKIRSEQAKQTAPENTRINALVCFLVSPGTKVNNSCSIKN